MEATTSTDRTAEQDAAFWARRAEMRACMERAGCNLAAEAAAEHRLESRVS